MPDGTIELPGANTSVKVAGLTTDEARLAVQRAYDQKALFQPNRNQLTVLVTSPLSGETNLRNTWTHSGHRHEPGNRRGQGMVSPASRKSAVPCRCKA